MEIFSSRIARSRVARRRLKATVRMSLPSCYDRLHEVPPRVHARSRSLCRRDCLSSWVSSCHRRRTAGSREFDRSTTRSRCMQGPRCSRRGGGARLRRRAQQVRGGYRLRRCRLSRLQLVDGVRGDGSISDRFLRRASEDIYLRCLSRRTLRRADPEGRCIRSGSGAPSMCERQVRVQMSPSVRRSCMLSKAPKICEGQVSEPACPALIMNSTSGNP